MQLEDVLSTCLIIWVKRQLSYCPTPVALDFSNCRMSRESCQDSRDSTKLGNLELIVFVCVDQMPERGGTRCLNLCMTNLISQDGVE
jgi:hypothetical protein